MYCTLCTLLKKNGQKCSKKRLTTISTILTWNYNVVHTFHTFDQNGQKLFKKRLTASHNYQWRFVWPNWHGQNLQQRNWQCASCAKPWFLRTKIVRLCTVHRTEYKTLNNEINALKLRVKKLMTFENVKHSSSKAPFGTGPGVQGIQQHSSCLVFKYSALRTMLVEVPIGIISETWWPS